MAIGAAICTPAVVRTAAYCRSLMPPKIPER